MSCICGGPPPLGARSAERAWGVSDDAAEGLRRSRSKKSARISNSSSVCSVFIAMTGRMRRVRP
eukprot:909943-Pyramimonas_sp.AAC.1